MYQNWIAQENQKANELRAIDAESGNLVAAERMADQHAGQGIDHLTAEPGLDAVPATGHNRPHQCRQTAPAVPNEARASTA